MNTRISRRDFAGLVGLGLSWPFAARLSASYTPLNFRVRTITAGLQLRNPLDLDPVMEATAFLEIARAFFQKQGYEVQTTRIATQALQDYLPNWTRASSIQAIKELDQYAQEHEINFSIGPVILDDYYNSDFAPWATELIQQTKRISFSCRVASAERGVHLQALRSAAEAIHAIAEGTPGGEGNFRFAATAFVPAGTPFFPAAYFDQGKTFSIGLESPNLLTAAFAGASSLKQGRDRLKAKMEALLGPVAQLGNELAQNLGWRYLGIDASPAPGLDASIGKAVETLIRAPFGSPSTLAGCAVITDVLKGLSVETCGYTGLMLPILEDPVLAQRAKEGRFGVSELLLFSSVCGTGLDVVPLPGDTSVEALAAVVLDVAALATKYQKPLSARLFPIPGKQAGDKVSFDNPHLTESIVLPLS